MKLKLVSALALLMGLGSLATADDAAMIGPEIAPLAAVKAGEVKHLELDFYATAYFLFIPITGKAEFDVQFDPSIYNLRSRVKTTGIADLFVDYDMQLAASGYVNADGLAPYSYVSQNYDGKKDRRVEMTYGETDVAMTAKPGFGDLGFPPATPDQKLEAMDPISAMIDFVVRPQNGDNPCRGPIRTFDGKQLTHLHLTHQGMTRVKTPVYSGEVIECHIKVDRVAGYNEGDKGKNLSGIDGPMRLYIAQLENGLHVPVKVTVDTEDIGRITLETRKLRFDTITTREASGGVTDAG